MQLDWVQELIDVARRMLGWHMVIEVECVQQRRPCGLLTPHHRGGTFKEV